jgi:hypothetical protein
MKKKIVRLGKLNRLHVHSRKPDQGVGPCALELSAVLNCWSNTGNGAPDATECKAFVESLTNCMRTYVYPLLLTIRLSLGANFYLAKAASTKVYGQLPSVYHFKTSFLTTGVDSGR